MQLCCPECTSVAFKRNGYTRHGKQNHRCLDCGRQFCIEQKIHEAFVPADSEMTFNITIERVEADELWSFGKKKPFKHWVWIALDMQIKQVIAFYVDSESKNGAEELWKLIPEDYKLTANIYTNLEEAFKEFVDFNQHYRFKKIS